uniref:Uncharacterized protein n=1 Tax=Setaria italica TaxID=4555 RepID=K3ZFN7_SETIT
MIANFSLVMERVGGENMRVRNDSKFFIDFLANPDAILKDFLAYKM